MTRDNKEGQKTAESPGCVVRTPQHLRTATQLDMKWGWVGFLVSTTSSDAFHRIQFGGHLGFCIFLLHAGARTLSKTLVCEWVCARTHTGHTHALTPVHVCVHCTFLHRSLPCTPRRSIPPPPPEQCHRPNNRVSQQSIEKPALNSGRHSSRFTTKLLMCICPVFFVVYSAVCVSTLIKLTNCRY